MSGHGALRSSHDSAYSGPISGEVLKVRKSAEGAALERQESTPHETLYSLVFIRPNPLFAIYENLPIYVHLCAFAVVVTSGTKNLA
jgi:hypothetical protein